MELFKGLSTHHSYHTFSFDTERQNATWILFPFDICIGTLNKVVILILIEKIYDNKGCSDLGENGSGREICKKKLGGGNILNLRNNNTIKK